MAIEQLKIDENSRNVSGAISSTNGEIRNLRVDETTNELLVKMNSDIEIGAVELKDGATDNRAVINAANTTRTATDKVLLVQQLDATGNVGGGYLPLSIEADYCSPFDFTATYTSSTTITITGAPFTVDDASILVVGLMYKATGGTAWNALINGRGGVSMVASSGVITVYGAGTPFATGDTYRVSINAQCKAYDSTLDIEKTVNQSPDRSSYVQDSLVDTTNVAAATGYYPSATGMSMDGFRDLSLTGKIIEGDAVTDTLELQATNDEDTTNADWVSLYGFRTDTNAVSNIVTTGGAAGTYLFAWDFDNLNYSYFRVKYVMADSTNTLIIKARRKSL